MDNQQRSTSSAPASARASQAHAAEPASQGMRAKAEDAVAKLTDVAQQAGSQAKQTASSMAAEATQGAKGFLNSQVAAGADLAGHVAESVRSAADKLEPDAPQIAGLVRGAADGVERFSRDMRGSIGRGSLALRIGLHPQAARRRVRPRVARRLPAVPGAQGRFRRGGRPTGQSYPRGPRVGEHSRQAYGP